MVCCITGPVSPSIEWPFLLFLLARVEKISQISRLAARAFWKREDESSGSSFNGVTSPQQPTVTVLMPPAWSSSSFSMSGHIVQHVRAVSRRAQTRTISPWRFVVRRAVGEKEAHVLHGCSLRAKEGRGPYLERHGVTGGEGLVKAEGQDAWTQSVNGSSI